MASGTRRAKLDVLIESDLLTGLQITPARKQPGVFSCACDHLARAVICFDHVIFSWNEGKVTVFGGKIVFESFDRVLPSGFGKTTEARPAPGFVD